MHSFQGSDKAQQRRSPSYTRGGDTGVLGPGLSLTCLRTQAAGTPLLVGIVVNCTTVYFDSLGTTILNCKIHL